MTRTGDTLAAELDKVAQRTLSRVFTKHEKAGPLDLPKLQAVADRVLPGSWKANGLATLERLLRLAIGRLEGNYHGSLGRKEAAYILFNLDSPELGINSLQLEGVGGKWYPHILAVLKAKTNMTHSRRGLARPTRDLRLALARVMLDPDFVLTEDIGSTNAEVNVQRNSLDVSQGLFRTLVGELADREAAIRYVIEAIPRATEEEVEVLVNSLCLHASLIVKAVDFFKNNEEFSVRDLSSSIARDAALAMDTIQGDELKFFRLTESLRRLIGELSEQNPDALVLLELLTFGCHHSVSFELAGAYLLEQRTISNTESAHASFAIKRALAPLLEYGMVELIGASIKMDRLAQDVFASLLKDRLDGFLRKAYALQCESYDELWDAGWSPIAVATRKTFAAIAVTRLADREDGYRRRNAGGFGGPEWAKKAGDLWLAHFTSTMPNWINRYYRGDSSDKMDDIEKWDISTGLGTLQQGDNHLAFCLFLALSKGGTRTVKDVVCDAALPLSFEEVQQGIVNMVIEPKRKRLAVQGFSEAEIEEELNAEIAHVREHVEGTRNQYDAIVAGAESSELDGE